MTATFTYNSNSLPAEALDTIIQVIEPIATNISTAYYDCKQSITAEGGDVSKLTSAIEGAGFSIREDNSTPAFAAKAFSSEKSGSAHFVVGKP